MSEQTREQILEQLIRDYEELLASIQAHTPIRKAYILRADELYARAKALGILEDMSKKAETKQ